VLDDIVEGLLGGEEDIVTQPRRKHPVWQFRWDVNAFANTRGPKKLLCKVSQITEQTLDGVVPRTYGPNDFVQFLGQIDGLRAKPLGVLPGGMGRIDFLVGGLAEEVNVREAGAEIIMDVLGNPQSFPLHPAAMLQPIQSDL